MTNDKNGNMLSYGSDTFGWNVWGQMTGSNQSGVSRQYKYDASGRLSSVQTGSSSTTPKQWLGWTDLGSGDPGLGLDNPLKGLGGKWNLSDGVGSITGQVDPTTGAISARQSFGPFGEEAASNAGNSGFGGRDRVGNGILYFRNRMYSPLLGRFLSEDPIGFSGSPDGNFFAYCGNDPVNFTDPLGLAWGWSNGGLWWGDDADHPSMWFGNMPRSGGGGVVHASYRCSGGDDDPDGWMDGPNLRMSSAHEGMDGKSARSRWAHQAAHELGNQVTGAAFAMATGGLGLAGEALGAVTGEVSAGRTILYHGTKIEDAVGLLNGAKLDSSLAAANKIDGPLGFFLADHYDDAVYFALRRQGGILEYHMTPEAISSLTRSGAILRKIPPGGFHPVGNEFFIPPGAFDLFNDLRSSGHIIVKPM